MESSQLFEEFQRVALELEVELEAHDEATARSQRLERELDKLADELGLCDLDPVADDLLNMAYSDLHFVEAGARALDPRRKYKGVCVRPEKRLALYLRDKFTCTYCGKDLHDVPDTAITLDHVKPRSKGGTNDPRNLVTTCRSCNSARQDTPLSQYAPERVDVVRRRRRRSYTRYHGLAKAMLAQQFSVRDIRTSREYEKWI